MSHHLDPDVPVERVLRSRTLKQIALTRFYIYVLAKKRKNGVHQVRPSLLLHNACNPLGKTQIRHLPRLPRRHYQILFFLFNRYFEI